MMLNYAEVLHVARQTGFEKKSSSGNMPAVMAHHCAVVPGVAACLLP